MVLSSWLRAVAGLHPVHLMNETQRQMAANPQTKSNAISGGEMSVSHNVLHSYIGSPWARRVCVCVCVTGSWPIVMLGDA